MKCGGYGYGVDPARLVRGSMSPQLHGLFDTTPSSAVPGLKRNTTRSAARGRHERSQVVGERVLFSRQSHRREDISMFRRCFPISHVALNRKFTLHLVTCHRPTITCEVRRTRHGLGALHTYIRRKLPRNKFNSSGISP